MLLTGSFNFFDQVLELGSSEFFCFRDVPHIIAKALGCGVVRLFKNLNPQTHPPMVVGLCRGRGPWFPLPLLFVV